MSVSNENINFYLKRPSGARKSFALTKYKLVSRTKKEYLPLTESEAQLTRSINALVANKTIDVVEAETRFKKFIAEHKRKSRTPSTAFQNATISEYNQKIFNKFWNAKYEDRELVDSGSARYDFARALRALGTTAADAPPTTIRKLLEPLPLQKIKRIYARLNEIRDYIGINDRLTTNRTEVVSIEYVTIEELKTLLSNIHNYTVCAAIATLFATGVRMGELLALTPKDQAHGYVNVVKQLRPNGTTKTPKRNKAGKVVVIAELENYVKDFVAVKDKKSLWGQIYNTLVEVSQKVLKRHIHPHDLRHSHAIYLLGKGASLTLIALQLRNRIEVCQKYYAGFEHTNDTLQMLKLIASS